MVERLTEANVNLGNITKYRLDNKEDYLIFQRYADKCQEVPEEPKEYPCILCFDIETTLYTTLMYFYTYESDFKQ